jgi:uncharacterized damage-inducible protein DinB
MNEIEHLVDTIQRAFKRDAWHGPSVSETLEGVNASTAFARHSSATHSIWEAVLHISAWMDIPRRRIDGERLSDDDLTWEDNWPPVPEPTEQNWQATLAKLSDSHRLLIATITKMPGSKLDEKVDGKDYSFQVMLHGIAQHMLYHAGQIALLKKLSS